MMQENPYGVESLWQQGDAVIKTVAIMLLIMSIISWSIIIYRTMRLWSLSKTAKFISQFWQKTSFDQGLELLGSELLGSKLPGSEQVGSENTDNIFKRLAIEARLAFNHHRDNENEMQAELSLSDWLILSLRSVIDDSAEQIQKGLSVLASIGSTAPFIGLFGTVWGIYHALVSIGISGQASISKVAGPVGEALIMTALGLAVAIPAVLGYNALNRSNKKVMIRLNRFAYQLHTYFLSATKINTKNSSIKMKECMPVDLMHFETKKAG